METLNPLDWTAGPFLMLYAAAAGITLLALQAWKGGLGRPVPDCGSAGLGVLHLAYLAGGADRAAKAALVGLFETGAAVPDRKRRVVRFDPSMPAPPELQPFRHMSGGEARFEGFQTDFAPRWRRLHDDLAARGLVPSDAEVTRFRTHGTMLLCLPLGLGLCKVAVGLSRDRPVGILVILLILTVVLGAGLLAQRPHRGVGGTAALAIARRDHARAARAPLPDEMALAFALSGAAVLAGRDYRWALKPGGSSADGSSGDSGGGDGGGGCGGCGG